jgi:hypothetical protein
LDFNHSCESRKIPKQEIVLTVSVIQCFCVLLKLHLDFSQLRPAGPCTENPGPSIADQPRAPLSFLHMRIIMTISSPTPPMDF